MCERTEDGATSVEYGLLVGFIAALIFGAVLALGQTNGNSWQDSCTKITAPMGETCP